jgi:putative endonuclease
LNSGEIMDKYYIYILKCGDKTLYTGITNDVEKRMKAHRAGEGAKYTRGRGPLEIMKIWEVEGKSKASKVEYFIKTFPRQRKNKFISDDGHLEALVLKEKDIVIKLR